MMNHPVTLSPHHLESPTIENTSNYYYQIQDAEFIQSIINKQNNDLKYHPLARIEMPK
jgi:hypothetical protein